MSRKLIFPIVVLELIKIDSKMPNLELKSQHWEHKKPRKRDFASITSKWFIRSLFLKFASPSNDYQLLTSQSLRFSVFIGHKKNINHTTMFLFNETILKVCKGICTKGYSISKI